MPPTGSPRILERTAGYVNVVNRMRSPRPNDREFSTTLTAVVALTTGTTSCGSAPTNPASSTIAVCSAASKGTQWTTVTFCSATNYNLQIPFPVSTVWASAGVPKYMSKSMGVHYCEGVKCVNAKSARDYTKVTPLSSTNNSSRNICLLTFPEAVLGWHHKQQQLFLRRVWLNCKYLASTPATFYVVRSTLGHQVSSNHKKKP